MELKNSSKIFISKEYSNAAGKLHLSFYTLHDIVSRELSIKIEAIERAADPGSGSLFSFFMTIFSQDVHEA